MIQEEFWKRPLFVQGWESDSRRIFGKGFGPKVCKKWTFFPKLGLAGLGLGLGLAFQGVK